MRGPNKKQVAPSSSNKRITRRGAAYLEGIDKLDASLVQVVQVFFGWLVDTAKEKSNTSLATDFADLALNMGQTCKGIYGLAGDALRALGPAAAGTASIRKALKYTQVIYGIKQAVLNGGDITLPWPRYSHTKGTVIHMIATHAVNPKDLEVLETLIARGDVNAQVGTHGLTPLHAAIVSASRNPAVIKMLLDAGADVKKLAKLSLRNCRIVCTPLAALMTVPLDNTSAASDLEKRRAILTLLCDAGATPSALALCNAFVLDNRRDLQAPSFVDMLVQRMRAVGDSSWTAEWIKVFKYFVDQDDGPIIQRMFSEYQLRGIMESARFDPIEYLLISGSPTARLVIQHMAPAQPQASKYMTKALGCWRPYIARYLLHVGGAIPTPSDMILAMKKYGHGDNRWGGLLAAMVAANRNLVQSSLVKSYALQHGCTEVLEALQAITGN